MMLESAVPMALVWERDFLFLYNDRYAEIIQDKHPAALGSKGADIFPETWDAILPLFQRAFSGEALVLEDLQLSFTRNGVTKSAFFSFNYNPFRDERGEVRGFLAVVNESTSRVLREQERGNLFNTVLSSITDFAYTMDLQGRFLFVNKALLDLWGITLEQATGKTMAELGYSEEVIARVTANIARVISQKATVRDEVRYLSPRGVDGYYEYILSPVLAADGTVSVIAGSTREITARKNLELQAAAASKAKDNFLAALSHELRTPLNPVLLLATDGSQNTQLPADVRADFKTIADNVRLEALLIDDLLDISRVTHDKLPLQLDIIDLHAVLTRAVDGIQGEAEGRRISLTSQLAEGPAMVLADEVRLHQIATNLLGNAVKFTPHGGSIHLRTARLPKSHSIAVEVTDSGIGLSRAEIEHVFQPFVQGEHSSDSKLSYGGLGLGLTIARKLVELHLGTITATSPGRGQGSTFRFELPLATRAEVSQSAATPSQAPSPADRAPLRVLLVEDHDASRLSLTRLLTSRNLEVIGAASAREALQKASVHTFDFVISDIGLPDGDGFALMKALRATYGCPGIALSGYGTERDIAMGKEAGFSIHLTKPVHSKSLYGAVDQVAQMIASSPGGA